MTQDQRPSDVSQALAEQLWVRLEEARLTCERLAARVQVSERSWLRHLHREIGLAGYAASEHLPSLQRRRLLEVARDRVGRDAALASSDTELTAVRLAAAQAAIETAGLETLAEEHLCRAAIHMIVARELLLFRNLPSTPSGLKTRQHG